MAGDRTGTFVPRAHRHARERSCIVSRKVHAPDELIRFALAPDGSVVPDLKGKLPGRGCWVEARRASVMSAVKKRLFSRAFKTDAHADAGLADLVDAQLCAATLGALGLIRKAGAVITGETKVEQAARAMPLACVLHAADGAANGLKKLQAALTAGGQIDQVPLIRLFNCAQLSLALGLPNVIHAAVPDDKPGMAFTVKALKLARFRGEEPLDADKSTNGPANRSTGHRKAPGS